MLRTILTAAAIFTSSQVFALTKQIDVVGLIPGVSSKLDFIKVEKGDTGITNVIGGYEMVCVDSYIDTSLSRLLCTFGDARISTASNETIYQTLKSGFTKKFGAPKVFDSVTSNKMGTKFSQQIVVWKDQKGNELSIMKRFSKIDEGLLHLRSAKQIQVDVQDAVAEEKSRKF